MEVITAQRMMKLQSWKIFSIYLRKSALLIPTYMYICHGVCLGFHFPFHNEGAIRASTSTFCSEQLPLLRWPGTCTDFPTISGHDIIGASGDDVLMMWGFQMMTFMSHLHQGWRGIKGRMHREKGFSVLKFQG